MRFFELGMSEPAYRQPAVAPAAGPRPPGSRGRPRDERVTRAITEAALRQLLDEGYARLSMESVASEAGVSRATIYRRFKDKADLVTAAIAGSARLEAGTGGSGGPGRSDNPRADLERFLLDFDDRFNRSCLEVLGGLLADREDPTALALHRARVIEPRRAYRPGPSRTSPRRAATSTRRRPLRGAGHARRACHRPGGERAAGRTWGWLRWRPRPGVEGSGRQGRADDLAMGDDEHGGVFGCRFPPPRRRPPPARRGPAIP